MSKESFYKKRKIFEFTDEKQFEKISDLEVVVGKGLQNLSMMHIFRNFR
jgi:hypothetical protein